MKSVASVLAATAVAMAFAAAPALAQSSGSFSATGTSAACTINTSGSFVGGTSLTSFQVDMQTSNASGLALLIRPSLVTGLFTDTKITTTVPSASADVGIQVCVTVDDSGDNVGPASCVVYDQRFQQISTNLFGIIEECATADPACNFELILSTLSAHSFDFVASNLGQGAHTVKVTWSTIGAGVSNSNNASIASCVGPGILTVTQVKNFSQNTPISFSGN